MLLAIRERDAANAEAEAWGRFFDGAEFQKLAEQAKADIDAGLATPPRDFDDPIWDAAA